MLNAAKVVVDVALDEETLSEIEMLRSIRLEHYESMAADPVRALEKLKEAGLTEESSPDQVAANAYAKIIELKGRMAAPNVIYEDELALYLSSFE